MPQSILNVVDVEIPFKHGSDEVTYVIHNLQKISILFWAKVALLQWPTGPRCMALDLPHLIYYSPPLSHRHIYGAPATLASLTFIKLCKYPPTLSSLQWLLSQPGMLFLQIFAWSASSYIPSSVRKYHFQKPTSEKLFKIARPPDPGLRDPMNCFSPPCFIALITH